MSTLVVTTSTGVADRVRVALFALELARSVGRRLELVWPVNAGCGAHFDRLFETTAFDVHARDRHPRLPLHRLGHMSPDDIRDRVLAERAQVVKLTAWVDDHSYAAFDTVFAPTPEIEVACDAYDREHFGVPTIGVHVRGGDRTHPKLDRYYAHLDRALAIVPALRIFVATDAPDEIAGAFAARYGARTSMYPVRALARDRTDAIIDAVIVMLLLRRLPLLVTSNYSGFSRLAAGGSRVDMIGEVGLARGAGFGTTSRPRFDPAFIARVVADAATPTPR